MSSGGRFSRPTSVQVAEDGDAEYIIPVKKENRALPLLRQLLGELSPAARASLSGGIRAGNVGDGSAVPAEHGTGKTVPSFPGTTALSASMLSGNMTQNNQNVSAPVTINVNAMGSNAEQIGETIYNKVERINEVLEALRESIKQERGLSDRPPLPPSAGCL